MGCSSLNIDGVSKRVVYSESELRTLIEEIQSDLANPATVQERRPGLQQLLTACFATWDEIVEKYAERPQRG